MKNKNKSHFKKIITINLGLLIFVSIFSQSSSFVNPIKIMASGIGAISAGSLMPEGFFSAKNNESSATKITTESKQNSKSKKSVDVGTANATSAVTTEKVQPAAASSGGKVSTVKYTSSSANLTYKNILISNKAGVSVDVKKQLSIAPDIKIVKHKKPQVLIVHTHATECYFPEDNGKFDNNWLSRTTDAKKNVISVGEVIAKKLNDAGIVTIHDKTLHDSPAYSGSYDRARSTIKKYLNEYPSIDVVLDLHRDAITHANGTKVKPTATIAGKKAAQIMISTGCQAGRVTGYSSWLHNFRFGLRVQQACETKYPGLARPLYLVAKKYNHDLNHGALLIEMGSLANTLNEAKYSAQLLSDALISVFNGLT